MDKSLRRVEVTLGATQRRDTAGLIGTSSEANYHRLLVLKMKNLKCGEGIFLGFQVETVPHWLCILHWNTCIKKGVFRDIWCNRNLSAQHFTVIAPPNPNYVSPLIF